MVACKRPRNLSSTSTSSSTSPPSSNLAKSALAAKSFNDLVAKVNRGIDTDVIVSEVQETSRKPTELYEMIERLSPFGRKIGLSLSSLSLVS